MQPNSPSAAPSRPVVTRSQSSAGLIIGLLILFGAIYLVDHGGDGEVAVFGSVERHVSSSDFHSAQCTAVFGDCKLDLRDAQMQGSEARMNLYSVFGSVQVFVPEDWEVVNQGVAVFGSMGHKRRQTPKTKTLILDGAAVFGSVEVKN